MSIDSEDILEFIEKVEIIGTDSSIVTEAKCDTGAKRVSIDRTLAEKVGLGEEIKTVTVTSSNGSEERSVYEFDVIIGDDKHTVLASITDREDMKYDMIIGRDILSKYLVDCETD